MTVVIFSSEKISSQEGSVETALVWVEMARDPAPSPEVQISGDYERKITYSCKLSYKLS